MSWREAARQDLRRLAGQLMAAGLVACRLREPCLFEQQNAEVQTIVACRCCEDRARFLQRRACLRLAVRPRQYPSQQRQRAGALEVRQRPGVRQDCQSFAKLFLRLRNRPAIDQHGREAAPE